jgi:hypothetical protein
MFQELKSDNSVGNYRVQLLSEEVETWWTTIVQSFDLWTAPTVSNRHT